MILKKTLIAAVCSVPLFALSMTAQSADNVTPSPRLIQLTDMGSFMFAGNVKTAADGEMFHGDHGYAPYFIPAHSHFLPIVMWHGGGQSGKSWKSTPDGRDGAVFTAGAFAPAEKLYAE